MYLNVYKVHLSEERYREVNAVGWGGVDWATEYLGEPMTKMPQARLEASILRRAEKDFYRHAMIVEATDLEDVFRYDNTGNPDGVTVLWHPHGYRSMSVGEVVIDSMNRGWLCVDVGFVPLSDETVFTFQTMVATRMLMGDKAAV